MNKRVALCFMLVCAAACGFAQNDSGGFKKRSHANVKAPSGAVTVAEASASFDRVAGLFKTVLHVNAGKQPHSSSPNSAATRAQIVKSMMVLYKAAEPQFTNTPKAVPVEYARLRMSDASAKPMLVRLIQRGCVAGFGPLATNKQNSLSVEEFGDALGFFMSRIAEMTNHSDSKWTPYLKQNN